MSLSLIANFYSGILQTILVVDFVQTSIFVWEVLIVTILVCAVRIVVFHAWLVSFGTYLL